MAVSASCLFFTPGGRDAGGLSLRHPAAAMGSGQWAITASLKRRRGCGRNKNSRGNSKRNHRGRFSAEIRFRHAQHRGMAQQCSSRSPDLRILSFHPAFSDCSNDRLSSWWGPPRTQWRYRSGFAPDSLFSPGAGRFPGALEYPYHNCFAMFCQPLNALP